MPATIETRIFKLRHDPDASRRIGYLVSQQRLAYNYAVNILNRTPDIALRKSPRHPDGLLGQMTQWRRRDERAKAPYLIQQSGAQQAWLANKLMRQERQIRLIRLANGSTKSADHREHRRTIARRSRKHGPSTLTSLGPPVRLDDSTFTIGGARELILRTRKPVPNDLNIRSFQLVEVRRECRGLNGALQKRRYALHLQIAVEYPDPPAPETIDAVNDILGIDDGVKRHLSFSTGQVFHHDESAPIIRQRQHRKQAQFKRRGSKRQASLLRRARKAGRKQKANRRRILTNEAKRLYDIIRPKAIALENKNIKQMTRSGRGTRDNPGTKIKAKAGLNRAMQDAALSERLSIMVQEASKVGIAIYAVWPQGSSQTCSACGYRHRENRESQARFRCLQCGYEDNADVNAARILRNRAFHLICSITGRDETEGAPTGWRIKPSVSGILPGQKACSSRMVAESDISSLDERIDSQGPSPQAGSIQTSDQDAQKQINVR